MLGLTFVVGLEPELAAAAGVCKAQSKTVELRDVGDGDHIAASIPTVRGLLEIHAQITTGKVAGMTFYLGGKEMMHSKVPKAARSCIKSASTDDWHYSFALADWLIPPAQAKDIKFTYTVEEADFGDWGISCVTAYSGGFKAKSCQIWAV